MYLHAYIKHIFSLVIVLILYTGCGGAGEGDYTVTITPTETAETTNTDTTDPLLEEITGQFIDGPVQGLTYMCSSGRNGVTNERGEFTCYQGNTVTFKAGPVVLGSILADKVITPVSLHPNNPEAAVNVAQLLQSLDDDDDRTTITIDATEVAGLDASLDVEDEAFEEKVKVMLTRPLVSKEEAIIHLNENLTTYAAETTISADGMQFVRHEPTPVTETPTTVASLIPGGDSTTPTTSTDSTSTSGSSGSTSSSTTTPTPSTPAPLPGVCQNGPADHEGRVTDIVTGSALANVTVDVGGCTTTTDINGHYELPNIAVSERAVVTFRRDGYYANSVIIAIQEKLTGSNTASTNYLEATIDKYDYSWDRESDGDTDGAHIGIVPSSYIDAAGKPYKGMITAHLAFEDSSSVKTRDSLPGAFEGRSSDGIIVPFVTYRHMVITAEDTEGDALDVSADVSLRFPNVSETTAQTIPLWRFDYFQGIWIEDGYATRQSDGGYIGAASHLGTWSLSLPIEEAPGTYRSRIVHEDGTPAKDVRVYAVGSNWISSDLSTDADGDFELKVVPESSFTLKIYDFNEKYNALFEGTIPAVASGETAG